MGQRIIVEGGSSGRDPNQKCKREPRRMDVTTIRIIAGVLAVVVLFIIIWRRRGKAIE